ncbi:MAG TPA: GntR family transcriptional regulator [Clostridiaceae bacterium]|nr:GntR family transcriptional regulator [Clostridiaceae bacterium]
MTSLKFLHDVAYEYLREMIVSEKLVVDKLYYSTDIAKSIDMSLTPVRDALQRLEQDGYVEVMPSRGFRVRRLTNKDIREIVQFRCAIEGYCASQLGKDIVEGKDVSATVDALRSCIDSMEQLQLTPSDISEFSDLDSQFHLEMVRYLNNTLFNVNYDKNVNLIKRFLVEAMNKPYRMEESIEEHNLILDAILQGNTADINENLHSHIIKAGGMLLIMEQD